MKNIRQILFRGADWFETIMLNQAFAVRAKAFGLVWFLIICCVVAVVNYWSIMRCVIASSRFPGKDDYSEITEIILGKKMRVVLNIFIIVYSYGF